MKRLIYQVAVGPQPPLYEFCIDSVNRYCRKQGIDHRVQKAPKLSITPDPFQTNRSREAVEKLGYLPIYEKENAFDFLHKYDEIAIIDADVYIRECAPNIFDHLNEDKVFGAVVEREMPITDRYRQKITSYSIGQYTPLKKEADFEWDHCGAEFMNMGVMVFRKGLRKYIGNKNAEQFIRQPRFKRFVDGLGSWKWSTDQTLLNYWLRADGVPYQKMDWRFNALYRGVKDSALPESWFIHFFLKDHLPNKGDNVEQVLRGMNLL